MRKEAVTGWAVRWENAVSLSSPCFDIRTSFCASSFAATALLPAFERFVGAVFKVDQFVARRRNAAQKFVQLMERA